MSFSIHTAENAVRLLMMQGEKEPTEICRRLFHADMLHLSKYGRSILRDTYTRQGTTPIPQRTAAALSNPDFDPKEYDGDYLSVSDVECLKASTAEGTAQTQKAIGDTPDGCAITTETMLRAMGEDDGFIDYVLEQEELERWLSGKTKL
jgi:hypothetical protein